MNAEQLKQLEDIRARYDERPRLMRRQAEIYDMPPEDISPALDAEALECHFEYESEQWSDRAVHTLLQIIDAQQAIVDAAEEVDKQFKYLVMIAPTLSDKPDTEIVSIGHWTEPVPGWMQQFNARIKYELIQWRKGYEAWKALHDALDKLRGE